MQREILSKSHGYGGGAINYGSSSAFSSPPMMNHQPNRFDFPSPLFPPNPRRPLVDLNDDYYSGFGSSSQPVETMTSCLRQLDLDLDLELELNYAPPYHQELMDRHRALVSRLREVSKQANDLRQENVNLKMANFELNNQLNILLETASFKEANDNLENSIAEERENHAPGYDDVSDGNGDRESPTSVMDSGRVESSEVKVDRVVLPKSISVRSSGYLKAVQGGGSSGGKANNKAQNKTKTGNPPQRVYVQGGEEEEQPLELEVYNQGMFKTELCNKWQQTGTCPYGENCQFAHGIQELRPIIRHPRYKTEVCRMVLNGDPCPYGHRCHFRHTLTDEEKLMRSVNARSFKPLHR